MTIKRLYLSHRYILRDLAAAGLFLLAMWLYFRPDTWTPYVALYGQAIFDAVTGK